MADNSFDGLVESTLSIKINGSSVVFVTGATGLVGSHLIQQLIEEGKTVRAIYRNEIPKFQNAEKVNWVKGDILDVMVLDEAMEGVEQVYHCAAVVSFSPKRKQELFKTNIEGTANVVNAALNARVKKLCFVSSVAALGKAKNGVVISEQARWSEQGNNSNYGKSKYLSELEVWRGIGEGLQAVIVNPAIILGAGTWNESSTKIFKTAYQEFPWYTEGVTGFVDVKDVIDAMIQLMESNINGERFILSAANKTYKDIFTSIADEFGKKAPHRKVNRLLANIVWRAQSLKSMFTGSEPLLTRETADAAQTVMEYDNSKLKSFLPSFSYTPLKVTIGRVCKELKEKNNLR